jgi:hypothetical protein
LGDEQLQDWAAKLGLPAGRALVVGCSVGGSAFELAGSFAEVEKPLRRH